MASPKPANRSRAEREIRAVQAKRVKIAQADQDALDELAQVIKKHMEDGASATEIATWITSPEKPRGVTRQYVYKLVEERGDTMMNEAFAPKPKPKVVVRPRRPSR